MTAPTRLRTSTIRTCTDIIVLMLLLPFIVTCRVLVGLLSAETRGRMRTDNIQFIRSKLAKDARRA